MRAFRRSQLRSLSSWGHRSEAFRQMAWPRRWKANLGSIKRYALVSSARWRHYELGLRSGSRLRIDLLCGAALLVGINMLTYEESVAKGEEWKLKSSSESDSVASMHQYAANNPIEDRCHMERLSNGAWWFSVFDGHGGWQCSDYANGKLHTNVAKAMAHSLGKNFLDSVDSGEYEDHIDRKLVAKALKSAFERTDRQYMVKVFGAFELGFGRDTRAGSCALCALVLDDVLFVCNAGDSRAVLAVNSNEYAKLSGKNSRDKASRPSETSVLKSVTDAAVERLDLDDFLAQAALKDSTGEYLSPEVAEALRNRLIHQVYELQQSEKKSSVESSAKISGERALSFVPDDKGSMDEGSDKKTNRFVTAVRMLTGGDTGKLDDEEAENQSEFTAIEMSNDHNCREPVERRRLERDHPGEKDVVLCRKDKPSQCYVKGKLQPTRSFGDFYLKYPEFMREAGEDASSGRYVPPPYTPPYISASPEVQIRSLRHGVDEFLILATDGLWDMMTSEEAINIAGNELRKPGGNPAAACVALSEEALSRAAEMSGMSTQQLKALKPGSNRRSKHDDVTIIVVDLRKLLDMHYWG